MSEQTTTEATTSIMCDGGKPLVWAGPILRRAETQRLIFWIATSQPVSFELELKCDGSIRQFTGQDLGSSVQHICIGNGLYAYGIDLTLDQPLPEACWIGYDLKLCVEAQVLSIAEWGASLCYEGRSTPGFVIRSRLLKIVHGSCRKPHSGAEDGLVALDQYCANTAADDWPSLLVLSGDQIYADDVAGPMLEMIHQLIPHFGITNEPLPGATIADAEELHSSKGAYYRRDQLLPQVKSNENTIESFFGGIKKPIFTTVQGGNHLISFAEIMAMYILCWSPSGWSFIASEEQQADQGAGVDVAFQERFEEEQGIIKAFAAGLKGVQRILAHLPTAMIFDDHDVTDDWNLSIAWEQAAYGNPLSKRIIGNAMMGYFICQGWGNAPEKFKAPMLDGLSQAIQNLGGEAHQDYIDQLLGFCGWNYTWPTSPPLIVIDSRTNRWRSEKSKHRPSGLMDWESITDLQQELCGHSAVVMVSPAPVFGVKLIEVMQRIMTLLGKPLMVDAENWMAHPGSAYALLNLFRHPKTPEHFTILSGDVHYSFVSEIELKGHDGGPKIWQITSSGIKNEFPKTLLDIFDRLNRWLYSPRSPLNWFTKRKRMRVLPYKPKNASHGERLVNDSGLGFVEFDESGQPVRIMHLSAQRENTEFEPFESEARWEQ